MSSIFGLKSYLLDRTGGRFSKDPVTSRARKAILETMIRLPWKAALWIFFSYKERQNNCQVSKLETCSYWRYKRIYITRKVSGRSRKGPQAPIIVESERGLAPWRLVKDGNLSCQLNRKPRWLLEKDSKRKQHKVFSIFIEGCITDSEGMTSYFLDRSGESFLLLVSV